MDALCAKEEEVQLTQAHGEEAIEEKDMAPPPQNDSGAPIRQQPESTNSRHSRSAEGDDVWNNANCVTKFLMVVCCHPDTCCCRMAPYGRHIHNWR